MQKFCKSASLLQCYHISAASPTDYKKQIAFFISFSYDGLPDLSEHHQWTTSSGREGVDVMGELIASHLVEDDK